MPRLSRRKAKAKYKVPLTLVPMGRRMLLALLPQLYEFPVVGARPTTVKLPLEIAPLALLLLLVQGYSWPGGVWPANKLPTA